MTPRERVVEEARAWLLTPYHHMARIKGAGVDCLTLLAEVYERAGIIPHAEIPFYPPDWNLHRDEERYLKGVMQYAREIDGPPLPGDIAVFKFGRTFAHGVIVTEWPKFISANMDLRQVIDGSADDPYYAPRPRKFFSPFTSQAR